MDPELFLLGSLPFLKALLVHLFNQYINVVAHTL